MTKRQELSIWCKPLLGGKKESWDSFVDMARNSYDNIHWVSYDSVDSIKQKVEFANKNG